MDTKLHFSRFEFKYLLPRALRNEVEKELQHFIELDPYVAGQPGNRYFVRSLYYDNRAMVCYYEKIDGTMDRAKFRLRTYTDSDTSETARFLEVKGRHNAQVFKHRVELASHPRGGPADEHTSFDPTTRDVLRQLEGSRLRSRFVRELYRRDLAPVMLVDYQRRPYLSKYDPEFRLTFDESLAGWVTTQLFPRRHDSRRRILPGYTILELKFRYHVPKWFHRIIQSYELRRVSISKYCAAVEAFDLTPKLE
ncbi:MAG: polyphosphate polymerase domain-containing protein [Acidobacteriota bacterium]